MRYIKKTVLFFLLFIGIALLLSPLLEGILVEVVSGHYLLDHYTASQVAENTRQAQLDGTVIDEDIAIQDLTSILQNFTDVNGDQVIGAVAIPAVGLYQPVFNGTTKASLIAGAGTMKSDQVMGQGNYCLAGHHMRDDSLLFGPLMEVKPGDWIQLTDKARLYTYEVTEIETVHQNDVEVLEDTTSPAITLITCNQSGVATKYRLVVRGTLIDNSQYEDDKEENEYLDAFRYLTVKGRISGIIKLWIWLIGSGVLAALLLGVGTKILRTGGKRNESGELE
ncbi:MAG: class A sortase [Lachnospiraceae bacterium]